MLTVENRQRARSITETIQDIENDSTHHLEGPFASNEPTTRKTLKKQKKDASFDGSFYDSKGLWNDLKSVRWMTVPSSSFKLAVVPIILYINWAVLGLHPTNPFAPFLFISHHIPTSSPDDPRYAKGGLDVLFVAYHIVLFSFIRQFTILKVIHPLATRLGITRGKLDRFGEQVYAVLYYGSMGAWGMYIMKDLPTWWYRTEYFWNNYPHWDMEPLLKRYYLMQLSYWLQQIIVLAFKIEKPRKDYDELVAHHLVTIWLILWSYFVNLTYIGNAIFISMDVPDTFLGLSKICNYLKMENTKTIFFAGFSCIWTYFRHWLNLVILWSVYSEFELVPDKRWDIPEGLWMLSWMKWQIFVPILLLQFLNLFWYYLILRIIYRAFAAVPIDDDRSDDEDEKED